MFGLGLGLGHNCWAQSILGVCFPNVNVIAQRDVAWLCKATYVRG